MTTFAIDNTPVSVTLFDNETYSPASGSVQKVKIQCSVKEVLEINGESVKQNFEGAGEPNTTEITVILQDTDTVADGGRTSGEGVHISGFEVN